MQPSRRDRAIARDEELARLHGREWALTLYYQALCGSSCFLAPHDDDAHERQRPDTATTVRLPSQVSWTTGGEDASRWYDVAVMHRALHHELGTFDLELDRAEPIFERLRPTRSDEHGSDLEAFFRSFSRPALAVEVFATLEDLRIDEVAKRHWKGLSGAYAAVQRHELTGRPDLATLPPRPAVAEVLVRLSLGEAESITINGSLVAAVTRVAALAETMRNRLATVETTAEATIRTFSILAQLPGIGSDGGESSTITLRPVDATLCESPSYRLRAAELRLEGDEVFDVRFRPVQYRDAPGPRYLGQHSHGVPMREAILRMTTEDSRAADQSSLILEQAQQAESGQVDVEDAGFASPPEPLPHDHGPDLSSHHHPVDGKLRAHGRREFTYPEWDFVAAAYRQHWCLVRESRPRGSASEAKLRRFLNRNRGVLRRVISQLEWLSQEGAVRRRRWPSGDDLDLDASIEAMVDLRQQVVPTERIYSEIVRAKRDVVVGLVIDMSSSTGERLNHGGGGELRRILDLECQAVALLAAALDRIGDAYGVYGFSGTGRADVRIQVVKGVQEGTTSEFLRRLAALRPHHTTRMGPAIRHVTRELVEHEAETKLLFLLSDGRPFDVDYGQQHGERHVAAYALADTAHSLDEARSKGVHPHVITIDVAGEEYLSSMLEAHEYRVIEDPRDLPAALTSLYAAVRAPQSSVAGLPIEAHNTIPT